MGAKHKNGICAVPDCGIHQIVGRGLCGNHWHLFKRNGTLTDYALKRLPMGPDLMSSDGTKSCGTCKNVLPIDCFALNPSKKYPLRRKSVCKKCTKAQSKKLRDLRKATGTCLYCDIPSLPGSNKCAFHITERLRWRATAKARVNSLFIAAKRGATIDGRVCTIDENWIRSKLDGRCELTGLPFDFEAGHVIGRFNPYAPSIDRKIAGGDYSPENCRIILTALNVGINFWGEEIYRKIAKAYLRQRRTTRLKFVSNIPETCNLLLENPQGVRMRKH